MYESENVINFLSMPTLAKQQRYVRTDLYFNLCTEITNGLIQPSYMGKFEL